MKKKSQAAMEFLMTYGWAILVVLVFLGALTYFGVFNPDNFDNNYEDDVYNCMFGCVAGLNFNGSEFLYINSSSNQTVIDILVCENFCNLADSEGAI